MALFDIHAHLTHPTFLGREEEVLARARDAGVTTVIANGLHPVDNQRVLDFSKRFSLIKPALGFYPVDVVLSEMVEMGIDYPREAPIISPEEGVEWLHRHVDEAFAVGEIGLDGHWVPEPLWHKQEVVFRELVKLAMEADKPIIIHTRKRERRAFEILQELGPTRVNWHCFGGKVKLARTIAEHGHYFSIPANAKRSQSFTRMLETLPRDRLLLETDCPYLASEPGLPSEPASVAGTAKYAAELWGCTEGAVEEQLSENFTRLFRCCP